MSSVPRSGRKDQSVILRQGIVERRRVGARGATRSAELAHAIPVIQVSLFARSSMWYVRLCVFTTRSVLMFRRAAFTRIWARAVQPVRLVVSRMIQRAVSAAAWGRSGAIFVIWPEAAWTWKSTPSLHGKT